MCKPWRPATSLKKDSNTVVFLQIFQMFLTAFSKKQLRWLLLNKVLVSKKILKRKFNRKIAFALINLFNIQIKKIASGQLTWNNLSFLQNLLSFTIKKYLKQEVDDDLSPCGLVLHGDIKFYKCHVIKR